MVLLELFYLYLQNFYIWSVRSFKSWISQNMVYILRKKCITTHRICISYCWCFSVSFFLLQTISPSNGFMRNMFGGCIGIRWYCVNSITSLSFDSPMLALMQKREEPTSTINTNIAARGCLPKTFLLWRCLIFRMLFVFVFEAQRICRKCKIVTLFWQCSDISILEQQSNASHIFISNIFILLIY